jgi:hypothetical protein
MNIADPKVRSYFYKVALTLVVAAQFFRLIPDDSVQVIVNVLTAAFAISTPTLAIPNTPSSND